ncbi:MAG: DUF177 domain-containing protein [bacterium]|nr:DUF177 domain-containing protein [bacterium]
MLVDLQEIGEGTTEYEWKEAPEDLYIQDEDLQFAEPIHTRITFFKLGESLSASGSSSFRLTLSCVRCLEPFALDLVAEFSFLFQRGRPQTLEGDEDESLIWLDKEGQKIDLGKEVKDYILLEVPSDPICQQSCAGLCPACGENLNVTTCSCTHETTDPRWEALRALKENQ